MVEFTPPQRRSLCAVAPSRRGLLEFQKDKTILRNLQVCVLPHGTRLAQRLTLQLKEIQGE